MTDNEPTPAPATPDELLQLHNRIETRLWWLEHGKSISVKEFCADVRVALRAPAPARSPADEMLLHERASKVGISIASIIHAGGMLGREGVEIMSLIADLFAAREGAHQNNGEELRATLESGDDSTRAEASNGLSPQPASAAGGIPALSTNSARAHPPHEEKDLSGHQGSGAPPAIETERVGWRLVPTEPTRAMVDAGGAEIALHKDALPWHLALLCYRAMLAAAPVAPVIDGESK